jgi:uncharacterized membrane protein
MSGAKNLPSAFSMTFAVLPSITATHEFVVPRSIPMMLEKALCLKSKFPTVFYFFKSVLNIFLGGFSVFNQVNYNQSVRYVFKLISHGIKLL